MQCLASRCSQGGKLVLKQLLPKTSYCHTKNPEINHNPATSDNAPKRSWAGWLFGVPPQLTAPNAVIPKTTAAKSLHVSHNVVQQAHIMYDNAQNQLLSMAPDASPKARWTLQGNIEGMRQIKAHAEQGYFEQATI